MNRADLAKLEAAATPGEWCITPYDDLNSKGVWTVHGPGILTVADVLDGGKADAKFIAACRSAVPVLLRRLDLAEQTLAAFEVIGHGPGYRLNAGRRYCTDCGEHWPCRYAQARAALAVLRRPLDQPDDTT